MKKTKPAEIEPIIRQNIRRIADRKGIKHVKIVDDLGMSKSMFSSMMVGKKILRPGYLPTIVNTLGCTYNDLFEDPDKSA